MGLPAATLSLDGNTPQALNATGIIQPPVNTTVWSHVGLWSFDDLANGDHTVTITVDEVDDDHPFYFDFFTVRTFDSGGRVIVDDTERFRYSDDWTLTNSTENYYGTAHATGSPGAKATFDFNGSYPFSNHRGIKSDLIYHV
jgi:hypothetical protein